MSQSLQAFYKLYEKVIKLEQSGKSIIKLHVGATMLPVPEVALNVLRKIPSGKSPYVSAGGLMQLRTVAAQREGCLPENIVVAPGSKLLIYALLHLLKKAGKHFVLPQPAWPAYGLVAEEMGLNVRFCETRLEDGWQFKNLPLDNACVALLCNPLNPTSTCYSPESIKKLAAESRKAGVALVIDEAYRDLAFEPIENHEAIRVRSFSKEFNMEGMRLGYAVVPVELAKELMRFMQLSVTCTSTIIQEAGSACLKERQSILEKNCDIWRKRLSILSAALRQSSFEFCEPEAGMYIFAKHPKIMNSETFVETLFERGVAVAPGTAFGPYPQYIRIAASEEPEILLKAVDILGVTIQRQ